MSGREIELRLQGYRRNFHRRRPLVAAEGAWGEPDVDALGWIEELAEAGHWGAHSLLRNIAEDGVAMKQVTSMRPAMAERLANFSPRAAHERAAAEVVSATPDWTRFHHLLGIAGHDDLAQCVAEAQEIVGPFVDVDRLALREALSRARRSAHWQSDSESLSAGMELLADLGLRREHDSPGASAARALLEAAAKRGAKRAQKALLLADWPKIADKEAFARAWCARLGPRGPGAEVDTALDLASPLPASELEVLQFALAEGIAQPGSLLVEIARARHKAGGDTALVGALIQGALGLAEQPEYQRLWDEMFGSQADRRAANGAWLELFADFELDNKQALRVGAWVEKRGKDPEAAARAGASWYALARDSRLYAGDPIPPDLCYFVAAHFNPRFSFCWAPEPGLARAWLERGIRLGNDSCLDDWLRSAAEGQLDIPRDPGSALERVRRLASAIGHSSGPLTGFTSGMAAICKLAEACIQGNGVPKDVALGRRWLLVAAEARVPEAMSRLAELDSGK